MRFRTCLAILALCLSGGHAEAGGFSLNGRELGERIESALNDPRYECGGVSACLLYTVCTLKLPSGETFAGAPLTGLSLHFGGERLTAIEAQFQAEQFDQVLADLTREYGPQQSEASGILRGSGRSTDSSVYLWREGHRLLRLERFSRDPAYSSLIISERSFLSELLGQ
jgi:hypothetical protein